MMSAPVHKVVALQSGASITGPSSLVRMELNDNKAGMEGLDKERINQIILEASKGSKFYDNELKKQKRIDEKIQEQHEQMMKITKEKIEFSEKEMDKLIQELEKERDFSRTIVHIDMDAFFAAVEMRDDPSLKDEPMAVGSLSMLSTSNYLARRYGVRAAMPGFIAKRLCQDLKIIAPNFEKYTTVSKQVREILCEYDENLCCTSLDEAYLDITQHLESRITFSVNARTFVKNCCLEVNQNSVQVEAIKKDTREGFKHGKNVSIEDRDNAKISNRTKEFLQSFAGFDTSNESEEDFNEHYSQSTDYEERNIYCTLCNKAKEFRTFGFTAEDVVQEIRFRIESRTHLTSSAGIASNSLLAKVCSDINKPNGQYMIHSNKEAILEFVKSLPIRKICGIGRVCEQMLKSLNIHTCYDLFLKRGILNLLYSSVSIQFFMNVALGISSNSSSGRDCQRKSLSCERTFQPTNNLEELFDLCQELAESVVEDASEEGFTAKTISVKIKSDKFDVRSRSHTLNYPTCNVEEVFNVAKKLLKAEFQADKNKTLKLRLLGLRLSSLVSQDQIPKLKTLPIMFSKESQSEAASTSKSDSDDSDPTNWICPVCNSKVNSKTLQSLNQHIDLCLNKDLVKTLSKEETFFSQDRSKKRSSSKIPPEPKEKKTVNTNTIDTYFKST